MAWKNIKQRSLGDALIVEHKALTELDDVHALINWLPLEAQLNGIHSKSQRRESLAAIDDVQSAAITVVAHAL